MIKFDFKSLVNGLVDDNKLKLLLEKKSEVLSKFSNAYMTGWTKRINDIEIEKILKVSNDVKSYSECLVVIGIGGSFLGSYAVKEMLGSYFNNKQFPIIYAGTTLSSQYMEELLEYLRGVDFSVNVISKSGTTMETTIAYKMIKQLLEEKYSKEEVKKRIIVTTDKEKGSLRQEVNAEGYISFEIPEDIGGRYSIMTAAHLFPLAFNIDIKKFVESYYDGEKYLDDAFYYACLRKYLADCGKYVENYCVYEEKLYYFTEWLKQLFGESEGKNGTGIFPVSTVHTRDLHSLGQFIQEGRKIIFETFIEVENSNKKRYFKAK